jgi:hypothetical protein
MAVIDNAFETKGTHVYFYTGATMYQFSCPTGVTGLGGGSKDRIDTTCLDELGAFRKYVGGFADPDVLSIPFVLYKGSASHQAIFTLRDTGDVVPWFVGLSDSATAPTTVDTDDVIVVPVARSGFTFNGYVSNVTIDAEVNEVVRGTLTVQPSGTTVAHWAA